MTMQGEVGAQLASAAAKTAPPVAVAVTTFAGFPWPTIVQIAAVAWIVLQAAHLLWRWRKDWRSKP